MENKKILQIILSIVTSVALIYTIYGAFFKKNSRISSSGIVKTSASSTDKLEIEFDKMLINLGKGKFNYIKAELSIRAVNENQKSEILRYKKGIRRLILSEMSRQNGDRLATDKGKQDFKRLIREGIREKTGINIGDIYFRNFILAR